MLFSLGQRLRQLFESKESREKQDLYDSDGNEIRIGPDKTRPYMTVFLSKSRKRFGLRLRSYGYRPIVYLDVKALPELTTALNKLMEEFDA